LARGGAAPIIGRLTASRPLFQTEDLGEGLRLHLHRTRAFQTVTARVAFHATLDEGTAARAVVPRVLARGTRRLPELRALQVELDRLFGASLTGDARKIGERQLVSFRADWVTDRLAGMPLLDRLADFSGDYLFEPAGEEDGTPLRAERIRQERKMLADEAAAIVDDKARYARFRLIETMCATEPYARPAIGRRAEIESLKEDDVRAAWRGLVERAPADVFLVGNLARRFARRLWRASDRRPVEPDATGAGVLPAEGARVVREHAPVGQAKLEMGFRTPIRLGDGRAAALALCNALFGGTPVGKLFKVVRERESLCYSIASMVERTKGLLLVHAGIDEAHFERARGLVEEQLGELRAGRIGTTELELAREMILTALRTAYDTADLLIGFALERTVNGIEPDLERLMADIGAVTADDVAEAARTVELDTVFLLADGKEEA